jgi:RHS repeat-associated protein
MQRKIMPFHVVLIICLLFSLLPPSLSTRVQAAATQLELIVSNPNPFAEEQVSVTVTARDGAGNIDPTYRGGVTFSSTSAFVELPRGGLGGFPYFFTAADAGTRTWTNVRLRQDGSQTLTVSDGTFTTSTPLTVKPVTLVLQPSVSEIFADEIFASITVRIEDGSGNLVPQYRGGVIFESTSPFVELPRGGLGGFPYFFTAADAGTHTWANVRLRQDGSHTLTVNDEFRQATVPITVKPVFFHMTATPTIVFPNQPTITVTLKIQDAVGNLVPGYRGGVTFWSTSQFNGLPRGGLGGFPYFFTAADAGQHVWQNVSLGTPGSHTLSVGDDFRTAQSSPMQVQFLDFRITFTPTVSFVNDRTLGLIVEAIDENGNLVPQYRGDVDFLPSVPTLGLPQSTFNAAPDYTFTEQDAGRRVFSEIAFTAQGDHTVTVLDRANPDTRKTTLPVNVTLPPDPQPVPPTLAPAAVSIPSMLLFPPPMTYSWGQPFTARATREGANYWRGRPDYPVPANPGTFYIMTGSSRRSIGEWWAGTAYVCPKMGWESVLRSDRREGGGLTPGTADPTFMDAPGIAVCGPWSDNPNNGAVVYLAPTLSAPAPFGAQGVHVNPEARGNVAGDYQLGFNDTSGSLECDGSSEAPQVADPIDTRSGEFYLEERDIGVATGCANKSLSFARTYRQAAPSTGSLGPGWVHNFEMRLVPAGATYVLAQRPRGSLLIFQDVGGDVYASRADSSWTLLKQAGGGWALINRDRRAEIYNANGRLTALQDMNGNQMWLTYETVTRNNRTLTRLARVDAPGGRFLWFGYDYYRPERITVVGDNTDRRMRFGYNDTQANNFVSDGVLVSATDATGAVSTYHYAPDGWQMIKKTDARGHDVFVNEYDVNGRVIRQRLNTGQDVRLSYQVITDTLELRNRVGVGEAAGLHALLVTTVEDQAGRTSYSFGSDGLLRLMTDAAGATTRYQQYTATRKPGVIVDALGRTIRMSYNERGQLTSITDTLSQTQRISYDVWGLPTRFVGLGQRYELDYDGPRLVRVRNHNGEEVRFGYSDQVGWKNALSSLQHSGSVTTTLTLNTAGDVTEIRDALGRSIRMEYDAAGRMTRSIDPCGSVTTLAYDAADRVIEIHQTADGLTRTNRLSYNAVGDQLAVTNALSQTTRFTHDLAGRVTQQTLADGKQLSFRFDPLSNLTGLTPPERGLHAFSFSPVNLVQQYQPPALPDGSTTPTQYSYDLVQQLSTLTRPDGSALTFKYDSIGRPTGVTTRDGPTNLGYDPNTYQLTRLTAPDATLVISHDLALRPVLLTWNGAVSGTVGWQYDALGRVVREQVGGLVPISRTYDLSGLPIQAGAANLTYLPNGDLQQVTLGNISETWRLNGFGEPVLQQVRQGNQPVFDTSQQRDLLGRVVTATTTISATSTTLAYTYDVIGQMTSSTRNGETTAYVYDANGNRIATTLPSGQVITATYDSQDRLLTWGDIRFTHTANGERASMLANGQTTSYTYDGFGNIQGVTLPDGTRVRYRLDGAGRRVGVEVNDQRVQGFLYQDDLRPMAELDAAGNVVSQFVYLERSNVPTYIIKGTTTYRLISDERGSVRLVVNVATGAVVQALDYDGWGRIISDSNPGFQPFGFAGGLYDRRTTLSHFGARAYDPATGRWLQKDPIGFAGGDANLYAYVGNDPVNAVDPTGQLGWLAAMALGAAFGAGLDLAAQLIGGACTINWTSVGISAAVGAAGAGWGNFKFLDRLEIVGRTAWNAVGSAAIGAAARYGSGLLGVSSPATALDLAYSAGVSAFFGGVGSLLGDGARFGIDRAIKSAAARQELRNLKLPFGLRNRVENFRRLNTPRPINPRTPASLGTSVGAVVSNGWANSNSLLPLLWPQPPQSCACTP